jgi:hypothetical protein
LVLSDFGNLTLPIRIIPSGSGDAQWRTTISSRLKRNKVAIEDLTGTGLSSPDRARMLLPTANCRDGNTRHTLTHSP